MTGLEVVRPQRRQVDIAVRQVGRLGHRAEQLGVLRPDRVFEYRAGIPVERAPQLLAEDARLVEPPGRPQGDQPLGVVRAEQRGEDPAARVLVVQEQHQVAEADQHVGAVTGPGERLDTAVDVADHVNRTRVSVSRESLPARPEAG